MALSAPNGVDAVNVPTGSGGISLLYVSSATRAEGTARKTGMAEDEDIVMSIALGFV